MPSLAEPVPFSFILATIAVIVAGVALGIVWVKYKEKKLQKERT